MIAIEVFEKDTDFDPRFDAAVRSGANRLRAKLKEYYQTEGMEDTLKIELPEGHYVARFITQPVAGLASPPASAGTELGRPAAASKSQVPAASNPVGRLPRALWTGLVVLALLVVVVFLFRHNDLFGDPMAGTKTSPTLPYPDREVN